MKQHNVDFIGGDFNMSAFSTVGDVFSDPEFSAPGNAFLWGLGALRTTNLPGPDSTMRSDHARQRRIERRHHGHERVRRRRT